MKHRKWGAIRKKHRTWEPWELPRPGASRISAQAVGVYTWQGSCSAISCGDPPRLPHASPRMHAPPNCWRRDPSMWLSVSFLLSVLVLKGIYHCCFFPPGGLSKWRDRFPGCGPGVQGTTTIDGFPFVQHTHTHTPFHRSGMGPSDFILAAFQSDAATATVLQLEKEGMHQDADQLFQENERNRQLLVPICIDTICVQNSSLPSSPIRGKPSRARFKRLFAFAVVGL